MAFNGKKYAMAVKVQADANTPATISTSTDMLLCYDIQPGGDPWTLANPEATGTRFKRGELAIGRSRSVTFNVILRGPGGASPPAADAFVFGRILRAVGYKEEVQATPLLATGAITAGTTTSGILPVGASATDDFYNGLPAILSDQGVGVKGITAIRDYVGSTRTAHFMETFGVAPAANVTIPAFLGYRFWSAAPDLYLSVDYWMDQKRYKLTGGTVSQFQRNVGVSNNSQTAFTYATITITGDVHPSTPEIDEVSPVVAEGGAIPTFRDADWWLDKLSVCGSSAVSDYQIQTARAPCPSKASGGEAPIITEQSRQWSLSLNEVLLSAKDFNALAQANNEIGTTTSMWAQYGTSTGKVISMGVCDGRLGYSEPTINGEFVGRNPTLFVDAIEKSEFIVYPYF
ncbi:hypothetical protein [Novosphingobium sp.]|uniref:hypothetical protein n=1 Tax=Novosphingobium sp. TaxID=1874826 RepID=UPI00286D7357|nr:hypothetical protein [Novosphingobium sp.]